MVTSCDPEVNPPVAELLACDQLSENWLKETYLSELNFISTGIAFADQDQGISINGENGIIRTVNGGQDWQRVNELIITNDRMDPGLLESTRYRSVDSDDSGAIYITGPTNSPRPASVIYASTILRTPDGGLTWEIYYLPALSYFEEAVFFGDGEGIIALGTVNPGNPDLPTLFKTSDGGETWVEIQEGTGFTQYNLIYESPYGNVFLVGFRGGDAIMLNYDMATGQITESVPPAALFGGSMAFYSETAGFAWSNIGEAFHTSDAGITWDDYENDNLFSVSSNMLIADADNWLLTEEIYTVPDANNQVELQEHKVSETLDGGLTWETRRLAPSCKLLSDYYQIPGGGYIAQFSRTTNILRFTP